MSYVYLVVLLKYDVIIMVYNIYTELQTKLTINQLFYTPKLLDLMDNAVGIH